jgi:hypothetical protein
MTHYSLTGCRSGKSIQSMRPSTREVLSRLTGPALQFLNDAVPRALQAVSLQAALLKVTVNLLWRQETSDGLTAKIIFSTLALSRHLPGLTVPPHSPIFQGSKLVISEWTILQGQQLRILDSIARQREFSEKKLNLSIYHVLTSQEIISAEALPQLDQSYVQYREKLFQE